MRNISGQFAQSHVHDRPGTYAGLPHPNQQEQRERNDKARTNRLCKRHGLLESVLPVTIALTEEQYEKFVKQHIANKHGIAALANITGQTVEAVTAAIEDAKNKKFNKSTTANAVTTEADNGKDIGGAPAPIVAGQNSNNSLRSNTSQNQNHGNQQAKNTTPKPTTPATTQGATA